MSNLGTGVLSAMLSGDNKQSAEVFSAAIGKTISALSHDDNALHFVFEDGYRMKLFDDGQSCCEQRYMRTDDKLDEYVGAKLLNVEVREAPPVPAGYDEAGYDEHEVSFLAVQTDRGEFVMSNHNEHSGYYGGFAIRAAIEG